MQPGCLLERCARPQTKERVIMCATLISARTDASLLTRRRMQLLLGKTAICVGQRPMYSVLGDGMNRNLI